jgi:hypothetical protein
MPYKLWLATSSFCILIGWKINRLKNSIVFSDLKDKFKVEKLDGWSMYYSQISEFWSIYSSLIFEGWSLNNILISMGWSIYKSLISEGWSIYYSLISEGWSIY